jgi:hypothetical protein
MSRSTLGDASGGSVNLLCRISGRRSTPSPTNEILSMGKLSFCYDFTSAHFHLILPQRPNNQSLGHFFELYFHTLDSRPLASIRASMAHPRGLYLQHTLCYVSFPFLISFSLCVEYFSLHLFRINGHFVFGFVILKFMPRVNNACN